MTTSGLFVDAHGLSGYEPNLTNSQSMEAWVESQKLSELKLRMDRFHQSLPGEVHTSSHRKQTLTILGRDWKSSMFTYGSKAETL